MKSVALPKGRSQELAALLEAIRNRTVTPRADYVTTLAEKTSAQA